MEACPYYGTRRGIAQAQIICLPYNLIVSKESRDALGISLKNNVVIFDEAHNIVESVNAVHSVEISYVQLNVAKLSLQVYLKRFRNILNGKNFFLCEPSHKDSRLISEASKNQTINIGLRGSSWWINSSVFC